MDRASVASREACCLEDAVFSRTSSWVAWVFMLCGLRKQPSFGLLVAAVRRMLVEPVFKLVIFLEQEFQCFAHDVGRSSVDELSVIVEFQFGLLV